MTTPTTWSISRDYDYVFKVVLIGDSGVGKSCILSRFSDDVYAESFIPTIGVDFRIRTVTAANGKRIKLQLWDTAGQERFHAITTAYYRTADAIMITYDSTDLQSFEKVTNWLDDVRQYCRSDIQIFVIGTKGDLELTRAVSQQQADELARSLGLSHLLTSAKTGMNINEAFKKTMDALIELRDDPMWRLRQQERENKNRNKFKIVDGQWTSVQRETDRNCCRIF